jgi:hypothetical protein
VRRQAAQQPKYGKPCQQPDPCRFDRCTDPGSIRTDIARAIGYVERAIVALGASPLTASTEQALDWYFRSHSAETATTARTRLTCIRDCLQETHAHDNFGCDPDDNNNLAYVCVGAEPICGLAAVPICYSKGHAGSSDQVRAKTSIHECAHRVGMSLGRPTSVGDIYRFTTHFLFMDTEDLLRNSDSYALFAGAIAEGLPTTLVLSVGGGYGFASSMAGQTTWQAKAYVGGELQRPVFGLFNPSLRLGVTFIGETTGGGAPPSAASFLTSIQAGVRIGDPRPGSAGGGSLSIFGGPAWALSTDVFAPSRIGAEAGVGIGYRWRFIDISAGVGYDYDPTRASGSQHLFTGTVGFTLVTGDVRAK